MTRSHDMLEACELECIIELVRITAVQRAMSLSEIAPGTADKARQAASCFRARGPSDMQRSPDPPLPKRPPATAYNSNELLREELHLMHETLNTVVQSPALPDSETSRAFLKLPHYRKAARAVIHFLRSSGTPA